MKAFCCDLAGAMERHSIHVSCRQRIGEYFYFSEFW